MARAVRTHRAASIRAPRTRKEAAVVPLHDGFVREIRPKMLAITAAAAFVLLIAGANVASLLLVRLVEREAETTLRAALGASRARLARRFLLREPVAHQRRDRGGRAAGRRPDGPALRAVADGERRHRQRDARVRPRGADRRAGAARVDRHGARGRRRRRPACPPGALRAATCAWRARLGTRGSTLDRGTRRTFAALVVWEIAVAAVLLTATGLVVRSFRNLVGEDWGFATENRLAFGVTFSERLRPEHAQRVAYVEQALERLRALPGVVSATATTPDIVNLGRGLAGITPRGHRPAARRAGTSSSTTGWCSRDTSRPSASGSSAAAASSARTWRAASAWPW